MWVISGIGAIIFAILNIIWSIQNKEAKWFGYVSLSLTALTLCAIYSAEAGRVVNEDWSGIMDIMPAMSTSLWACTAASILLNSIAFFKGKKQVNSGLSEKRTMIETEHLILREMTEKDFDALYQVLADSDIMQHYPYTFDDARVREWINRNIERYQIFGFGLWAVCLKETGEMIGDCGLTMQLINGQIRPEIGYHIRGDQQRKGYAKEAAAAVRDWTFHNTPFNVIYSYMKHTNVPSYKTAVSWGCKQVDEFKDDENEITKVFAISREEWAEK